MLPQKSENDAHVLKASATRAPIKVTNVHRI